MTGLLSRVKRLLELSFAANESSAADDDFLGSLASLDEG
jgi:hypothetical protein